MPGVGVVNMSRGATEWHPVCVIRTGTKNVAMQTTTDNFTKLFEIVHQCLGEIAVLKASGAQPEVRKLRRRKSNPHHPKGPPEEREYYCRSKGIWITKTRKEVATPPSGSGNRHKADRNRIFRKSPTQNPVTRMSRRLRPGPQKKARCQPVRKHGKGVLQSGDDDDDDGGSSSPDLFAE